MTLHPPRAKSLGTLGAEIIGLDLSQSIDNSCRELIIDTFNETSLLLFRKQPLSATAQIALTRLFGAVRPHPLPSHRGPQPTPELLVVEQGPGLRTRRNDIWHSDVSFAPDPPIATVLHAIQVPNAQGDTLICDMVRAYEQLSDGLKTALAGLRCVHSAAAETEQVRPQRNLEEPIPAPPARAHTLVRTHSKNGQKSLYINPHYVTHIENFSGAESKSLLDYLYACALRAENIYRHRWQNGDVLIWDNSRTMHYAVRNYDDDTVRIMHRTTALPE